MSYIHLVITHACTHAKPMLRITESCPHWPGMCVSVRGNSINSKCWFPFSMRNSKKIKYKRWPIFFFALNQHIYRTLIGLPIILLYTHMQLNCGSPINSNVNPSRMKFSRKITSSSSYNMLLRTVYYSRSLTRESWVRHSFVHNNNNLNYSYKILMQYAIQYSMSAQNPSLEPIQ